MGESNDYQYPANIMKYEGNIIHAKDGTLSLYQVNLVFIILNIWNLGFLVKGLGFWI